MSFLRRSRTLNDIERDPGLTGSSGTPARLPSVTSLTPSTPLRWKSSKRLELARELKSPKANKPKVVAKEDVKTPKKPRQQNIAKEDTSRSKLSKPVGPEEEDRALESLKDKTNGLDSWKNLNSVKGWLPKTDDDDNALLSDSESMVSETAAADNILSSAGDAAGEVYLSNSETLVGEAGMAVLREGAKDLNSDPPYSEQAVAVVAEEKAVESSLDENQVQGVDQQTTMDNESSAIVTTEQPTDQTVVVESPGIER